MRRAIRKQEVAMNTRLTVASTTAKEAKVKMVEAQRELQDRRVRTRHAPTVEAKAAHQHRKVCLALLTVITTLTLIGLTEQKHDELVNALDATLAELTHVDQPFESTRENRTAVTQLKNNDLKNATLLQDLKLKEQETANVTAQAEEELQRARVHFANASRASLELQQTRVKQRARARIEEKSEREFVANNTGVIVEPLSETETSLSLLVQRGIDAMINYHLAQKSAFKGKRLKLARRKTILQAKLHADTSMAEAREAYQAVYNHTTGPLSDDGASSAKDSLLQLKPELAKLKLEVAQQRLVSLSTEEVMMTKSEALGDSALQAAQGAVTKANTMLRAAQKMKTGMSEKIRIVQNKKVQEAMNIAAKANAQSKAMRGLVKSLQAKTMIAKRNVEKLRNEVTQQTAEATVKRSALKTRRSTAHKSEEKIVKQGATKDEIATKHKTLRVTLKQKEKVRPQSRS